MDVKDIKALINEVSSSDIYELRYEENGTKIQLSKGAIESDKNKGTVAATVEQQGQQPDNLRNQTITVERRKKTLPEML